MKKKNFPPCTTEQKNKLYWTSDLLYQPTKIFWDEVGGAMHQKAVARIQADSVASLSNTQISVKSYATL